MVECLKEVNVCFTNNNWNVGSIKNILSKKNAQHIFDKELKKDIGGKVRSVGRKCFSLKALCEFL